MTMFYDIFSYSFGNFRAWSEGVRSRDSAFWTRRRRASGNHLAPGAPPRFRRRRLPGRYALLTIPHIRKCGIKTRLRKEGLTRPMRERLLADEGGIVAEPRREVKRRPRAARSERLFENDHKRLRFRLMALGAPFCYTPGNYVQSACEEVFRSLSQGDVSGACSGSLGWGEQFPAFPAAGRKMSCLVVHCFSCLSLR